MKSKIAACFVYLFLYIPIIILILYSFNSKGFPSKWHSFTFDWYKQLFQTSELWAAFFNSLIVATSSMLISLFMGALLIFLHSNGGKVGRFIPLFYGNLVIPETILALGLIGFFAVLSIPLGLPTLIISHTILGLGFVVPILYLRYSEIDPRLKEASLVLGASSWQTFFKITLPMLKKPMIAVGMLIFVISFDDFILSYFCSGSSFTTLSIYLVTSIRYGISPVVNALASVLFVLTGILVAIFFSPKVRTRVF